MMPVSKMYVSYKQSGQMATNGSGIAEGRDLKAESFNLAQMPNIITND